MCTVYVAQPSVDRYLGTDGLRFRIGGLVIQHQTYTVSMIELNLNMNDSFDHTSMDNPK